MVDLVLHAGGEHPLGLGLDRLAVEIAVAEPHPVGPLDLFVIFRDREAALLVGALLLRRPGDLRIDQHHRPARLVRLGEVDHDEALRHADLDGGETDAGRVVHRLEHVRGEGTHLVGDLADRLGHQPQLRIRQDDERSVWHGRGG